ncbi:transcriptional repressor [Caulobacter phage CcrColossus]|uniref:Putative HTH domain DNA-binding protein n=1 Tax=Caulobacter phage CcrColossus TaxID=1211640 RepID=K4JSG8_9CAUD|nr:transcriptional repressor [Caulobacter phage CcrColossus]AFU88294.1 putative HTH domain DNA-binding protein [Caulobacter phage CcrColossus]
MKRAQCKAARVLLGWTQHDLAKQIGCATSTIADYERGARETEPSILLAVFEAFARNGVLFRPDAILHAPIVD